jgi:hypothetical protein
MNENIITAVAGIFTGKGGGLKLAIACIAALGFASLVTEKDYGVDATTEKGGSLRIKPNCNNRNDAIEEACVPDSVAVEAPV